MPNFGKIRPAIVERSKSCAVMGVHNRSYNNRVKMTSAHEAIYEKNNAVNSKAVEDLLKTESLVPNQVFNLSLC